MDIQDLRIFARVAAVQNLSAVGNELGLTPGTISKRIQALEQDLSVRLFDRTTRSIRITEEGATFYEHVQRILLELEKARSSVNETVSHPKGKVRISAPVSIGRVVLAPAVCAFMEAYPDVDIHINLTDRMVNLQEEGYDVAIRTGVLSDSSLIAKRLAADRHVIVGSPGYVQTQGRPQSPEDLAKHVCLMLGDTWSWEFQQAGGETESVRINGRLRSNNSEFLYFAALQGRGLARLSALRVRDDIAAGRLIPVLTDFEVSANAAIWAVYPSARHVMPKIRVLLDFLGDWLRDHNHIEAVAGLEPQPILV